MEKKIETYEVSGAQDIQALVGCMVTAVTDTGEGNEEGLVLDCKDENGNLVSLLILEDGSWHFHDGKRENITAELLGELAMLASCSDIDSVHFNNVNPLLETIIKSIGANSANRVLTLLQEIFPRLEVRESEWDFKGKLHPMYCCTDPNYYLIITVAVMPKNTDMGIVGN